LKNVIIYQKLEKKKSTSSKRKTLLIKTD